MHLNVRIQSANVPNIMTQVLISIPPPRSGGAGDYSIRVRLSVCLSVRLSVNNFYSALDFPYYWEESNETLHSERIYIVVVHLSIGFIEQRKMCL